MKQVLFFVFSILFSFQIFAQDEVVGVVTDHQSSEPMPFARVHVLETGEKMDTDFKGQYKLITLTKGNTYTLNFSFAGYIHQSIQVTLDSDITDNKEVNIEMHQLEALLSQSLTASLLQD